MRQQKREGDNENRVAVVANDDLLVSCDANPLMLFVMSLADLWILVLLLMSRQRRKYFLLILQVILER